MINRYLQEKLLNDLSSREIFVLTGPRRVGKTTLLLSLKEKLEKEGFGCLYVDFTDPSAVDLWKIFSIEKIGGIIKEIPGGLVKKVIFFDEIQYLPDSGKLLKLFYDHFPQVKIFATGSSSFLLLQSIGESLAGRKRLMALYPLALSEMNASKVENFWSFEERFLEREKLTSQLLNSLIFGGYPGIFLLENNQLKQERLREITESLLFKDLLMFEHIKKPRILVELTKLLAYQISNLVNPNEIAQNLGVSRKTVLDYIDLLEHFFVIKKVYPYENNLRDVIKKKFKVYFFDLGIRNAVIGDFRNIEQREDKGGLLENAVFIGLSRRISYEELFSEIYFYHDYTGKEIDFLIRKENKIEGIEVKWDKEGKKVSKSLLSQFPDSEIKIIDHKEAYKFCL